MDLRVERDKVQNTGFVVVQIFLFLPPKIWRNASLPGQVTAYATTARLACSPDGVMRK
jgi:hypothetical protein